MDLARGINGVGVRGIADRVHQRLSVFLTQGLVAPVEVFNLTRSLTYRIFQTHCEEMSLKSLPPAKRTKAMAGAPLASVHYLFRHDLWRLALPISQSKHERSKGLELFLKLSHTSHVREERVSPAIKMESYLHPDMLGVLWRITCQLPRRQ